MTIRTEQQLTAALMFRTEEEEEETECFFWQVIKEKKRANDVEMQSRTRDNEGRTRVRLWCFTSFGGNAEVKILETLYFKAFILRASNASCGSPGIGRGGRSRRTCSGRGDCSHWLRNLRPEGLWKLPAAQGSPTESLPLMLRCIATTWPKTRIPDVRYAQYRFFFFKSLSLCVLKNSLESRWKDSPIVKLWSHYQDENNIYILTP